MPKPPSDRLFKLIKSLTTQEKRYFRLFIKSRTERESKYLLLFDAMVAMETFDEAALKIKIYKSQPSESRKYSELKAYLYELILKSLQSFDEQQSVEYRLNYFLQSVAVLFKRGLYEDCRDLLHKAKKLAQQYEAFTHQLDIIRWEKQLAYTRMDADFLHKRLEQLHAEESQALERLSNAAAYRRTFFQIYTNIKREAARSSEEGGASRDALGHADHAASHKARIWYYRALNLRHYAALEYEEFYESGKQLIAILESRPHFLRESVSEYIAALSNLILSCGLLRKYDEVELCLNKLRSITPITEDDRRKIHRQYFSNKLVLCIFSGNFVEGRQVMEQCQMEAARFDPQEYETASFYFQYVSICFGNADYAGALDHLNHWLNQPRTVEREDLQSIARVLSLILHFEMGNNLLVESLMRSTSRFLKKKNRLAALERRFFQLMSELLRAMSPREHPGIFRKMKLDLEALAQQPEARTLLQTFDLVAWVDSKIDGATFAETVRRKWAAV